MEKLSQLPLMLSMAFSRSCRKNQSSIELTAAADFIPILSAAARTCREMRSMEASWKWEHDQLLSDADCTAHAMTPLILRRGSRAVSAPLLRPGWSWPGTSCSHLAVVGWAWEAWSVVTSSQQPAAAGGQRGCCQYSGCHGSGSLVTSYCPLLITFHFGHLFPRAFLTCAAATLSPVLHTEPSQHSGVIDIDHYPQPH